MFWIGLATALLGGLFSIGLSRWKVRTRYRAIKDYHLDIVAITVLLIGLVVSAADHSQSERSFRELKRKTASRILPKAAVEHFVQLVAKEAKGKVRIKFMANNPEAADYANAMRVMLLKGGYDVEEEPQPWFFFGNAARGVVLAVKDNNNLPPHATALAEAIRKIGIDAEGQHDDGIGDDEVFVQIGVKSP